MKRWCRGDSKPHELLEPCGIFLGGPLRGQNNPSTLNHIFHFNIRGRDRDRAVQRSPALECLNELLRTLICNSLHLEPEANGIEQRYV